MTGADGELAPAVLSAPGQAEIRQQAVAAAGATVVQVGGDLYVSDEALAAFWQPTETTPLECPYPGLEAFGLAQAKWFFGRERLTGDLIDLLDRALRRGNGGPIVVVGPSGAGKSSLLGAGLLKAVRDGRLPAAGSADWPVLKLTPGATPMRTLAVAAHQCAAAIRGLDPSADASPTWDEAFALLRDAVGGPGGFTIGVGDGTVRRVLVVADQFEELFTAGSGETEVVSFLDALSAIAAPGPGGPLGVVVVGMRADFYARATEYPVLRSALQSAQLVIGAMSSAEVTEAITRPARVANLRLDAGLAERLLRDLGAEADGAGYEAGRLPLLAYALRATWQRRSGNRLTIAAYEQTGGIGGAIAKAAEDVYATLSEDRQRIARQLLLALVHVGSAESGAEGIPDTRRRVTRAHLCASTSDPGAAAAVLDAFTAARLVTSGDTAVEITHDALLTRWPRLREWISQDRSGNLIHQSLEEAAAAWDSEGRDASALYSGVRLAAAHEWAEDPARPRELSVVARAFLAASYGRRRAAVRRRNGIIAILAALSVGLAVLTGYARHQQLAAENLSRQESGAILASQAGQAASVNDPGTAMEFIVEAQRLNPGWVETGNGLLDVQSQAFTGRLTLGAAVLGVAYSPNGAMLATGSLDGTLRLWDTATRQQITSLRPDHGAKIGVVAFSPSGKLFANDEPDGVRLWHVSGHRLTDPVLLPVSDGPSAIAFSPDGTMLAIGDNLGRVWLVSLTRGRRSAVVDAAPASQPTTRQAATPGLPQNTVEQVAFTPDGRTMITSTFGGVVRIWDVARAALTGTLPMTDTFGHMAISPDGRVLAVSSVVGTTNSLQLWWLASRTLKATVPYGVEGIEAMAFSPDGSVLAVGSTSGGIRLWDAARVPVSLVANLGGHTNQVAGLAFSPDGAMLASADADSTVVLWTVLQNTVDGYNDPADTAAFNPSATELAVASVPGSKVGVTLYTVPGRRKVTSLVSAVPKAKLVSALAFSPNGQTLAVATNDPAGTVQLWDIARHQVIGTIHTYQIPDVQAMAFTPRGSLLATAGYSDPVIRLWNPANQTPAGTLPGNSGYEGVPNAIPGAWSIAFSPDGTELAAADSDSMIRLWRMPASGASPRLLSAPAAATGSNAAPVRGVVFSGNGAYLAAGYGNGDVVVWRAGCLSCAPQVLHSDNEAITSIGFTAYERSLVTASQDGYVRLWPVGTWTAPETLQASGQSIFATVSPVGTLIATTDGNAVRLWDTNEEHVATWICQTLEVPVARSAWTRYGLTQFPYTPIC